MTKFRNVERNGKKRTVPIREKTGRTATRSLTPGEMERLTGVGIRHPGSLTEFGYHIMDPDQEKRSALGRAVEKYGSKEVLRKLGELYRLDYSRPNLRDEISRDIRYVAGAKFQEDRT